MKAALTALIVLTAFYLCTASLGFEGPGETLAFRPFHGLYPHYFVLDPDSSRLAVYHGSLPWWQTDSYITLFSTVARDYNRTLARRLFSRLLCYRARLACVALHSRHSGSATLPSGHSDFTGAHMNSQMTATPNHALQRTAPCVTAPASAAAFPPTMQVPRRTPRSLSLGSLADASAI
jgi:hypothetical protein